MKRTSLLIPAALAAAVVACAPHQETPQQRHIGLYRSVHALDGAIAVGLNNPRLTELLQVASAEMLISRDRVASPDEQAMAKMYGDALEAYGDSLKLWNSQLTWASEDYMKGRIPLVGDLERVAKTYALRVEPFKLPYSGGVLQTTPEEGAIQTVWTEAGKRSSAAAKAYLQLGRKK